MDQATNDLPDPVVNQELQLKDGGGIEVRPREARAPAEMRALFIARVCHEANRAYCLTIGDPSQTSWDSAPDWQRQSAVNGVLHTLANPDAGPESSHKSWLNEKVEQGWIYGAVKDPEKKEHPCMVPYDQLPLEQRRKDALFQAIVRALA
jgi:RyR domain-containing protein